MYRKLHSVMAYGRRMMFVDDDDAVIFFCDSKKTINGIFCSYSMIFAGGIARNIPRNS